MKGGGKILLPLVLLLLGGVVFLYSANRKKGNEILTLRQQLEAVPTQVPGETADANDGEEISRLKKENEEIHRLRNEVALLRKEKQLAAVQPQPIDITQEASTLPPDVEKLMRENEQLRSEVEESRAQLSHEPTNICIGNLRQIDGAKELWALENKKTLKDTPTEADLYGEKGFIKEKPVCPSGGVYTIHNLETPPTCSIPSHSLLP